MAAKAERRDFFLSLDQLDIIARTTLPTTRTTRYPLRKKTRTHFTRSRTKFTRKEIVRSRFLWVQRERERALLFSRFWSWGEAKSIRAKRERNKIFLERTKKLRRENNELWWPTTASASVVPGAQRVRVSAHIFRSRVSFVSETFSRSREVCVLRFRILVIILSFSSA